MEGLGHIAANRVSSTLAPDEPKHKPSTGPDSDIHGCKGTFEPACHYGYRDDACNCTARHGGPPSDEIELAQQEKEGQP